MKDISIITNYYPPEIGAASNRIYQLSRALTDANFNVSVVTPLPNYPTGKIFSGYKGKFRHVSTSGGIKIYRLWVYASNSKNIVFRFLGMLSFSISLSFLFITNKIPKTVIVQSPPLIVAFTCMLLLRSKRRKLILNISDLWPLAGLELGVFKKNFGYRLLEKIELFNYKKAHLILGQSEEILHHIRSSIPNKDTFLYRNYPSFEPPALEIRNTSSTRIKLVYAGLLGVAQGVYRLCMNLDYSKIEFHIYGSGAEQHLIEAYININGHLPIVYHGEISREHLHKELGQCDLAIIPLLNRIYGSVPSKIFEFSRLGIPILYFGGGEGSEIVKRHGLGWVANVGDYGDLNDVISKIDLSEITPEFKSRIQKNALKHFNPEAQINYLIEMI
jgi:glycosyltransferase involved in cell wall biosynthesis